MPIRTSTIIILIFYYKFHEKDSSFIHDCGTLGGRPVISSDPSSPIASNSAKACVTSSDRPLRTGTDTLVELGVRTGLSLLFNILRLNWSQESAQARLCADVLKTAADVLWSLPPMSLSNERKIPKLGSQSLGEVSGFLRESVMPSSGANLESESKPNFN